MAHVIVLQRPALGLPHSRILDDRRGQHSEDGEEAEQRILMGRSVLVLACLVNPVLCASTVTFLFL